MVALRRHQRKPLVSRSSAERHGSRGNGRVCVLEEVDPLDTHHFLELMSTLRSESNSTVPDVLRRSGPSRPQY